MSLHALRWCSVSLYVFSSTLFEMTLNFQSVCSKQLSSEIQKGLSFVRNVVFQELCNDGLFPQSLVWICIIQTQSSFSNCLSEHANVAETVSAAVTAVWSCCLWDACSIFTVGTPVGVRVLLLPRWRRLRHFCAETAGRQAEANQGVCQYSV